MHWYGIFEEGKKVVQNYSIRTDTKTYTIRDIQKEIFEDVEILASLGYKDVLTKEYSVIINSRAIKRLGQCTRRLLNGQVEYVIEINAKAIAACPPEEVHNIIVHEICHSVDGCMNHGPKWKTVAEKVNGNYQFTPITRLSQDEAYKKILDASYKHKITCTKCGNSARFLRMSKLIKSCMSGHGICGKCGGKEFSYEAL